MQKKRGSNGGGGNGGRRTQVVSFHVPRAMLREMDRLVDSGLFENRSELIRAALFHMIVELHRLESNQHGVLGYR